MMFSVSRCFRKNEIAISLAPESKYTYLHSLGELYNAAKSRQLKTIGIVSRNEDDDKSCRSFREVSSTF